MSQELGFVHIVRGAGLRSCQHGPRTGGFDRTVRREAYALPGNPKKKLDIFLE